MTCCRAQLLSKHTRVSPTVAFGDMSNVGQKNLNSKIRLPAFKTRDSTHQRMPPAQVSTDAKDHLLPEMGPPRK